jgi:hypothetical protein
MPVAVVVPLALAAGLSSLPLLSRPPSWLVGPCPLGRDAESLPSLGSEGLLACASVLDHPMCVSRRSGFDANTTLCTIWRNGQESSHDWKRKPPVR